MNQKIHTQKANVTDLEATITKIDNELDNSPHSILKEQIDQLEQEIREFHSKINKSEVLLAQKTTRLDEHVINSMQDNERKYNEIQASMAELSVGITENIEKQGNTEEKIKSIKEEINLKNQELSGLLKKKKDLESQRDKLTNELQKLNLEYQKAELGVSNEATKLHDLNTRLVELKNDLPEDMSVPEKYIEKSRDQLVNDVNECKHEITKLGNVNMMAIEKYNENKERFDDLTYRHEVLINERESILEFMDSIEKQKKNAFLQSFHSIARNFSYLFTRLSPGGEAKLELENREDPFDGGVLIMARPAGKPLNEISLLSGGEKSLTSLSLIFAIQQHCPSPLYILDEIDAALDDANASRVAELIKELSDKSQFIIVTHRDVTMTKVDQIFGVSNVDGCTDVMNLNLNELSAVLIEE